MRVASIDIGTNTILLLVAETDGQVISTLLDEQIIARLGKGVDSQRRIEDTAYERCKTALLSFKNTALQYAVEHIAVTGTSAIRDAANRDAFIARIFDETGLKIELLSGVEEAHWSYLGTLAGVPVRDTEIAVLDIGGGSTELTLGKGSEISQRTSLDIGCVRLTEKYLHDSPPTPDQLAACTERVEATLAEFPKLPPGSTLIGVAGTLTTLAAIDLGLESYNKDKVAGHVLTLPAIERIYERFKTMDHESLIVEMRVDPGRADIILAGVIILREYMKEFSVPEVRVSTQGLRYGIAIRDAQRLLAG